MLKYLCDILYFFTGSYFDRLVRPTLGPITAIVWTVKMIWLRSPEASTVQLRVHGVVISHWPDTIRTSFTA